MVRSLGFRLEMDFIQLTYLLTFTLIISLIIFHKLLYDFNYWKKKGVPYIKPLPFIGNILSILLFRTNLGLLLKQLYSQANVPYFGIYSFNKPLLVVRDPDLIKSIIVRDFEYFSFRTVLSDPKCDPIFANLQSFVRKISQWKRIRHLTGQTLTPAKLRKMENPLNATCEELQKYINKNLEHPIDAQELSCLYITEATSSSWLGINTHCFENNSLFRKVGMSSFNVSRKTAFTYFAYFVAPWIARLIKRPFFSANATGLLKPIIWTIIRKREENGCGRDDLIDGLILLKNDRTPSDVDQFEKDRIVAPAIQSFTASNQSTSSTMAFALYELSLHPEIQNKLRSEIQTVLSTYGSFTYKAVEDMKYMRMVLSETVRKYPPTTFLDRECIKDYEVPDGTNIVIDKGTSVLMPIMGLHHDPKYFIKPETFNPERFSDECKMFNNCGYFPFGGGPRTCSGERFAFYVIKYALANILSNYEVERCEDTPVPARISTRTLFLTADGVLPINFKKINNNNNK